MIAQYDGVLYTAIVLSPLFPSSNLAPCRTLPPSDDQRCQHLYVYNV